jgi:site-specific recombinase XerD
MDMQIVVAQSQQTDLGLPLEVREQVRDFATASKSDNTKRAYRAAWREFADFCQRRGLQSLPAAPTTVLQYVTTLAKKVKPQTLAVKLAGVSFAHRAAKATDPTSDESVRVVMAGIRRKLGVAPTKKAPAIFEDVCKMVDALPDDLGGIRDRAMLLLGFAGAFRRSELCALELADVHFNGKNFTVALRKSKTDQEGAGLQKTVPYIGGDYDPAAALRAWLKASGITSGVVFRKVTRWKTVGDKPLDGRSLARVVQGAALAAGLDPHQFAGHSLRAGFITSAALAGVPEWAIQEQTGHKSERVLRGYIRAAGLGASDAVRGAFGKPSKAKK